jgi:hypothetical protein
VPQPPGEPGRWRDLPPAPPSHGTFLAWYQGCRCDQCDASGQSFLRELARRFAQRIEPAGPATANCPVCGALRYHRCRDPHFPLHFTATHAERDPLGSGPR